MSDKLAEAMDINVWYAAYPKNCPNCGVEWKTLSMASNLWPHWTGACAPHPKESTR